MMTEYDPNSLVLDVLTFKNEDDWESSPVKTTAPTVLTQTEQEPTQLPISSIQSSQPAASPNVNGHQISSHDMMERKPLGSDFKGETVGSGGSRRPNVPDSYIIFCSNVDYQAEVDELRNIEAFKDALHVGMPIWINKDTGQMMNKGFGFVYFSSEEQCVDALRKVEQCGEIILGPRNNPNNIRPVRFSQSDKAHKKRNGYHDFGYQPHRSYGGGYNQPPRGMHHHSRGRGYGPRGGYNNRPPQYQNRGDYNQHYSAPQYPPSPPYQGGGGKPYSGSPNHGYGEQAFQTPRRGNYYSGGYGRGAMQSRGPPPQAPPPQEYYNDWANPGKRSYFTGSPQGGDFVARSQQPPPQHPGRSLEHGSPGYGGYKQAGVDSSAYGSQEGPIESTLPTSSFYKMPAASYAGPVSSPGGRTGPPMYGNSQFASHGNGQNW